LNDSQDSDLCFLIALVLCYLESILQVPSSIPVSRLPEVVALLCTLSAAPLSPAVRVLSNILSRNTVGHSSGTKYGGAQWQGQARYHVRVKRWVGSSWCSRTRVGRQRGGSAAAAAASSCAEEVAVHRDNWGGAVSGGNGGYDKRRPLRLPTDRDGGGPGGPG
jgi:hypothetical protein